MTYVETIEEAGFTAKIYAEEYIDENYDPRQWENVGTMVCWHPDYVLGDFQITAPNGRGAIGPLRGKGDTRFERDDFPDLRVLGRWLSIAKGALVIMPLYVYEHSGVTMRVGASGDYPFDSAGWDSTDTGYVYATRERIIECFGDDSPESIAKTKDALRIEVEQYALYLEGQVYGYVIEDEHGEIIDGCGGYLGYEPVEEEARSQLAYWLAERVKKHEQGMHQWRYVMSLAARGGAA